MATNEHLNTVFVGLSCTKAVRFATEAWRFDFGNETTLDVRCPWRIVANGRIALGNADHGQEFGLPKPVDGTAEAESLLAHRVVKVVVRNDSADLVLQLENDVIFEVFNSSSGYEGWECTSRNGLLAIARGGGELQLFHTNPPLK